MEERRIGEVLQFSVCVRTALWQSYGNASGSHCGGVRTQTPFECTLPCCGYEAMERTIGMDTQRAVAAVVCCGWRLEAGGRRC